MGGSEFEHARSISGHFVTKLVSHPPPELWLQLHILPSHKRKSFISPQIHSTISSFRHITPISFSCQPHFSPTYPISFSFHFAANPPHCQFRHSAQITFPAADLFHYHFTFASAYSPVTIHLFISIFFYAYKSSIYTLHIE